MGEVRPTNGRQQNNLNNRFKPYQKKKTKTKKPNHRLKYTALKIAKKLSSKYRLKWIWFLGVVPIGKPPDEALKKERNGRDKEGRARKQDAPRFYEGDEKEAPMLRDQQKSPPKKTKTKKEKEKRGNK